MIIHVKQSFAVKSPSGEVFKARNNDIIVPPDWVVHNEYFKLLCDSGKVAIHVDSKSLDAEIAKESQSASNGNKTKKQ